MLSRIFALLILSQMGTAAIAPQVLAQDFPYPPNSTFFTGKPPSFQGAMTFYKSIYASNVPYYFTIYLPNESVQSIGQVNILQKDSPYTINFRLARTQAFLGTPEQKGESLPLKQVIQDPNTGAIAVEFANPIPPNSSFTVGLMAAQNPSISGVYLFRIKAFPFGPNSIGMDLGVGRIQIYELYW
ncbi:MAG: DUF2808 domain-containing protein [Microcystaceae cyanobacterium]